MTHYQLCTTSQYNVINGSIVFITRFIRTVTRRFVIIVISVRFSQVIIRYTIQCFTDARVEKPIDYEPIDYEVRVFAYM